MWRHAGRVARWVSCLLLLAAAGLAVVLWDPTDAWTIELLEPQQHTAAAWLVVVLLVVVAFLAVVTRALLYASARSYLQNLSGLSTDKQGDAKAAVDTYYGWRQDQWRRFSRGAGAIGVTLLASVVALQLDASKTTLTITENPAEVEALLLSPSLALTDGEASITEDAAAEVAADLAELPAVDLGVIRRALTANGLDPSDGQVSALLESIQDAKGVERNTVSFTTDGVFPVVALVAALFAIAGAAGLAGARAHREYALAVELLALSLPKSSGTSRPPTLSTQVSVGSARSISHDLRVQS